MKNIQDRANDLLAMGYVEVSEFEGLRVGQRVRQANEQGPAALRYGTAEIERIFHKQNSAWARKYGQADVELIVVRDEPRFGPNDTHGYWSHHGTVPVGPTRG